MADEKDTEKYGWDLIKDALSGDDDKDPKKKPQGPPIYEPESYPIHAVAALAYVVPLLDAFDLGKYIFEAYPGNTSQLDMLVAHRNHVTIH